MAIQSLGTTIQFSGNKPGKGRGDITLRPGEITEFGDCIIANEPTGYATGVTFSSPGDFYREIWQDRGTLRTEDGYQIEVRRRQGRAKRGAGTITVRVTNPNGGLVRAHHRRVDVNPYRTYDLNGVACKEAHGLEV